MFAKKKTNKKEVTFFGNDVIFFYKTLFENNCKYLIIKLLCLVYTVHRRMASV